MTYNQYLALHRGLKNPPMIMIVLYIRDHGPQPRAGLHDRLLLIPSTVRRALKALQDYGYITDSDPIGLTHKVAEFFPADGPEPEYTPPDLEPLSKALRRAEQRLTLCRSVLGGLPNLDATANALFELSQLKERLDKWSTEKADVPQNMPSA